MLSFLLNSIQGTLVPDPVNLRRWSKSIDASCPLCGWKHCSQIHILCGCRVALEQGRISWRHDSLLTVIEKWIKSSKVSSVKSTHNIDSIIKPVQETRLNEYFVKQGSNFKIKKAQKKHTTKWWEAATDWKILVDKRDQQYQIPAELAASNLRPDMCVYSLSAKKCLFLELTSPFEDNIAKWKMAKSSKYSNLVSETRSNGWTTVLKTIEVGARGFVNVDSLKVFRLVGLSPKQCTTIRRELSKVAIRTSHYIWLSRNNKDWKHPTRVTS